MACMRGVLIIAIVAAAPSARANVEFDLIGGGHRFSKTNPYGVDAGATETEKDAPMFGLRLGFYFADRLGLEGEGAAIPTKTVDSPADVTDITYRGHLVLHIRSGSNTFIPFLLVGGGMMQIYKTTAITLVKDRDPVAYAGIGFKLRSGGGWALRLDFRGQFEKSRDTTKKFTNDFEGLLAFGKEIGGHAQRKVATAAPVEEQPREGAPPAKDSDGDGIPDSVDKCPNEPEDKDGFEDADGCPDPDNDGDGIADKIDKCPNEPEDKDGFEDTDGCPDPDNDKDGILDATDKCPNEPETKNGFQDEDGCPDEIPKSLKKVTGVVAGIEFKPNTAALTPGGIKTLDRVAKVLAGFPRVRIEIGVHTDDQPPPKKSKFADNAAMSQARADAIRIQLVKKGIPDMRLVAKGYGEGTPLVDPSGKKAAKLKAARAKNRRIELKLIVSDDSPAPKKDDAPTPPSKKDDE
jgi:OOP family OmpA-OmpF porin